MTIHEQHIFSPAFLNAARFGFNRAVAVDGGLTKVNNPNLLDASFGFIPGQFVGSIQSVPGITDFPGGTNAGLPGTLSNSKRLVWNSFQWGDDAFLTRGVNALQFGAVVERMQDNEAAVNNAEGVFRFSSLKALLTNQPRNFQGLLPLPIVTFGNRQTLFGAYIQDDLQARRNFTFNLGLRYEMSTVPTEAHGKLSTLLLLTDAQPHLGSHVSDA